MSDNSKNLSQEKREHLLDVCQRIKSGEKFEIGEITEIERFIKSIKYGLTFEKHEENVDVMLRTHVPIFKPFKEIVSDPSLPYNFLLEGDNLHSLKLLEKTHKGRIDVIYIDPPYNTLKDDFAYGDKMIDEEDGFKHSKWLSFMKERLEIAKRLMSKDGIIFISIDDNEQAQLKLLCDSIFGNENFYGQFIQKKGNTQNDSLSIQRNHEYILCYVRKQQPLLLTYNNDVKMQVFEDEYYLGRDTGASSGHDKLIERANLGYTVYYIEQTANGATGNHNKLIERANLLNNKYGFFNYYISKDGKKFVHCIAVKDYDEFAIREDSKENEVYHDVDELLSYGYSKIRPPQRKGGKLGSWTWGIDTFQEYWNKNEVIIKNNRNIIRKMFVDKSNIIVEGKKKYYIKTNKLPLQSVIEIGNARGTTELKGDDGVLPGSDFSNPKSVELLEYLIGAYCKKDCVVLDFFAGSGTTAQAVMQLNSTDGGNRQFILCTNNEVTAKQTLSYLHKFGYLANVKSTAVNKTIQSKIDDFFKSNEDVYRSLIVENYDEYQTYGICQSVTYPRLSTVITGNRPDGSKYSDGIKANLKYFQCEMIPKEKENLEDDILEACTTLVELEKAIDHDDKSIRIIFTDEELADVTEHWSDDIKTIYLSSDVEPDGFQEDMFDEKDIRIVEIPQYYYREV